MTAELRFYWSPLNVQLPLSFHVAFDAGGQALDDPCPGGSHTHASMETAQARAVPRNINPQRSCTPACTDLVFFSKNLQLLLLRKVWKCGLFCHLGS